MAELTLNVYKKGEETPAFTGDDTNGVQITGLAAGTVVAKGDYQASHTDPTGKLTESDKVDVDGFTVKQAQAAAPSNVEATATDDGANVTAG
ncbi:hypothetical protein ACFQ44_05965 [Levilactobacillus lanxiensis]|uniref:Uncharacterized protein n=1 Tax=Levilactobacillus lanxiensis TaxID=2799568 RepID=A0ABW4D3A2_9LACO|nr:hypothetical protein [Levilactobacillus lanxiensis]